MHRPITELYRLIYVSRAAASMRLDFAMKLADIVARSAARNQKLGVTGVLIAHDGWFVQALEGDRSVVIDLYAEIARDVRHEALESVDFQPAKERLFGDWAMRQGRAPAQLAGPLLNLTTLSAATLLELLRLSVSDGDDGGRLAALQSFSVLETLPEQQFDDLVEVAMAMTGAEAAAISLVDGDRRWLKAKVGLSIDQTIRDFALSVDAGPGAEVLWVEDAPNDDRLANTPMALADPAIRFLACAPLEVGGQKVGTLCVVGAHPKVYDPMIASALKALGRCVSARLEAKREERIAASLLSSASDAIICADHRGQITFWNSAAELMFGYASQEAIGEPLEIIVPARRQQAYRAALDLVRQHGAAVLGGRSIEVPAVRKDGGELSIEVAMASWQEGDGVGAGLIVRDCSERKASERALAEAKRSAESANVAKSAFLANMSHEIRTPLNGVIGVTELLARSGLTARQAEMAELIRSSGAQLHGLLGDILDLARIEAGEMNLVSERVSIRDLVTSTVDLNTLRASEKGLRLVLDLDPGADCTVAGDPIRTKQILTNLISNALKFTDAGEVRLVVSRTESGAFQFAVTDTGVGFDPDLKQQLFGRFQQADGSITRRFGGTGLGLAICRQLADLMGGEIDCSSKPGDGSTFIVRLPFETMADTPVHAAPSHSADQVEGRLTVLLADDHPTNRRVVELILENLDADITSVEDGSQALERFKSGRFDIVLMDMMMPIMDGLAATQAIRRYEGENSLSRTPVLMLTANALPEHIDAALTAGADRHVPKPITPSHLITAIVQELERAEGSNGAKSAAQAAGA